MRIYEAKITYDIVDLGEVGNLTKPEEIVAYMKGAFDSYPTQESFWVIALDRKNKPIGRSMVTLGTVSSSLVHPREVFRYLVIQSASAFAVVHNHPSGDPAPSRADISVTRQLREASKIMGIDLVDHLIIGNKDDDAMNKGFYSFNEAGLT